MHWLADGVCTLHTLGSARACVWLIATPSVEAAPVPRAAQRHWGCELTTLASDEQHEDAGDEEFPVMKLRQEDILNNTFVQLLVLDCAFALFHFNAIMPKTRKINHFWECLEAITKRKW